MIKTSFNIEYEYGGRTVLDKRWYGYNICLNENKLFYILSGELVIRSKNIETVCKAGDIVLVPARLVHDFYLHDGKSCEKFWFHFSVLKQTEQVPLRYDLPMRFACNEQKIADLFRAVVSSVSTIPEALIQASNIATILAYFIEKSNATEKIDDKDEIDFITSYIRNNLAEPLTLDSLCSLVYLSPGYFTRKFHAKMGVSPMKFVMLSKISESKRLLKETDLPVSTIMEKVGIFDSAYFSKIFKSSTGFSPRAFRKMTRNS